MTACAVVGIAYWGNDYAVDWLRGFDALGFGLDGYHRPGMDVVEPNGADEWMN